MSVSSEFGGFSNLIQPPPHELTAAEMLFLIYQLDPSDAQTDPLEQREKYQAVPDSGFEEKA